MLYPFFVNPATVRNASEERELQQQQRTGKREDGLSVIMLADPILQIFPSFLRLTRRPSTEEPTGPNASKEEFVDRKAKNRR
jgi:hypothetical protein